MQVISKVKSQGDLERPYLEAAGYVVLIGYRYGVDASISLCPQATRLGVAQSGTHPPRRSQDPQRTYIFRGPARHAASTSLRIPPSTCFASPGIVCYASVWRLKRRTLYSSA